MSNNVPYGIVDEVHPELFDVSAMRPQNGTKKPGQLSDDQLRQFYEEGYVIVRDFFDRAQLDAVRDAISDLVEELAHKLYNAGKIKNLYKDFGLFQRLTKMEEEFPGTTVILHKTGKLPQAFRDVWCDEKLLNIVEQIIGPDIAGSPVWNLRTKCPKNEATVVPWHQDSAYFDNESYKVMIPTAWIPLLDTDEYNGGMQVAKGVHKLGKVAKHQCCWGNTWYVMLEEEEMAKTLGVNIKEDIVTCSVPYGGFLFFNNMTPHRSLPNMSNDIRWALDLRWQRPDQPYGLWGLKDGILMRSSKDPNLKIDWEKFESVDRNKEQKASVQDMNIDEGQDSNFDATIQGPWMKKWELVHLNRHTQAHELMERAVNKDQQLRA